MELISQFLKKFSGLTLPHDTLKRVFIEMVKEEWGLVLNRDQIVVANKVLIIKNIPAPLRSELFLKKQKILARLKAELSSGAPEDIR